MSSQDINAKPGSLKTWLDYLDGIDPDKIELGLDRIKQVLEKLNLTIFKSIPVIEVAGTNGKGSTSALIAAALNYSGIKAGLYTSPHLHKFNERVNIGGRDVTDEELSQAFEIVHKTAGDINLSYFEYTTLAALVCFSRAKVGAVVLEIGLGGRLDAVNALDADIAVITSIGLDHTKILGDTIGKIAFEKAGIIKNNCQVVLGEVEDEAYVVIKKRAEELHAELHVQGKDFLGKFIDAFSYIQKSPINIATFSLPYPKIPFCCAPVAMRVITLLKEKGVKITIEGIDEALRTTSLPGRMQLVRIKPMLYLDVAHNPPAATHLAKTLDKCHKLGKRYAVIGMLKDKDIESVLKIVKHCFDSFYVATLHTQRGENVERIKSALLSDKVDASSIKAFDHVDKAVEQVLKDANENDEIIVLGSFVTVSEAMDALEIK